MQKHMSLEKNRIFKDEGVNIILKKVIIQPNKDTTRTEKQIKATRKNTVVLAKLESSVLKSVGNINLLGKAFHMSTII